MNIIVTDNSEFKVEKGVPLPNPLPKVLPKLERPKKYAGYPFRWMELGDSFAVLDKNEKKVRAASSRAGRVHDRHFLVDRTPKGQLRCWRLL